ncbi:hypothetical protein TNCV_2261291 [Trichonephila clavipes]|nr:hypothetical protein TNCV_2261291 [Trichonephila clavipes]
MDPNPSYRWFMRAERLSLPEKPALPVDLERIPTPPVEPEMPTLPVELERIPTPPVERPERLVEPERIPTPPVKPERPADPESPPLVDPSVFMDNAEVTPPLITRCDKGTQTLSPYLHIKRLDLGKRRLEPPLAPKRLKQNPSEGSNNIILWVPRHHPLMALGNNRFIIQPTNVNGINK